MRVGRVCTVRSIIRDILDVFREEIEPTLAKAQLPNTPSKDLGHWYTLFSQRFVRGDFADQDAPEQICGWSSRSWVRNTDHPLDAIVKSDWDVLVVYARLGPIVLLDPIRRVYRAGVAGA